MDTVLDKPSAQAEPAQADPFAWAASGQMSVAELLMLASAWQQQGQDEAAALLYQRWLEQSDSPHRHIACFNWGTVLGTLRRHQEAAHAYRLALAQNPGFIQARLNLGHQFEHLGQAEQALAQWREVWLAPPQAAGMTRELRLHAINNTARLLESERRYDEAEAAMVASLEFEPRQPDVIQHYVHIRQKQCEWPVYHRVGRVTDNQLLMGTSALAMLNASDDPALQLLAAHRFVADRVERITDAPLHRRKVRPEGRIRIGYLSGDFCMHAMGLLIPELLELHDRTRFEVTGFCFSREDGSALRQRLIDAMDHHVRIHELDDAAAAALIAERDIDILIDLQGLSSGARPGILARRPAPVQIGYLGLPATSAVPGVDYMIADPYVMQPGYERFCTEQPLMMPHVYQICDRQRPVAPIPTRADCGLPENAFVYCAFNNNHKITPEVFGSWMSVLRQVPDSVLWLLADNRWAQANLVAAAQGAGIDPARLIFAPRVAPPDYLARFAVADLFLDTFPYNAGATASDVLWMGTPMVTRSGRTYISRMAGSLLTNVGLPELITTTIEDYEALAVAIGRDRERALGYKRFLAADGRRSRLFDIPARVRDLEDGLVALLECSNAWAADDAS
ncbi:MAG: acetylglucosamine transferase [Burkholderiaceae bacterium]